MDRMAWLPGLSTLLDYRRSWLVNDLVAGLVLTAILVPVGMGYAEASGLPAINGLYATILPLVAYAVFGPSRIMVLGPDSTMAAVIAALIVPLSAGDPAHAVALAGASRRSIGANGSWYGSGTAAFCSPASVVSAVSAASISSSPAVS